MSLLTETLLTAGACVPAAGAGFVVGLRRRPPATQSTPLRAVTPPATTSFISPDTLQVLALLRSDWILLDRSDRVVRHSNGAEALGLIRGVDLRHEQMRELVRTARRENSTLERDVDIPRGPIDAGRVDLQVRVAALNDDIVAVLIEDLTQRRRIEETRRDFVVNVSHELKTPVGGLRLLAEAVEDAADDPEAVQRFAGRMKTETVRLTRLVQEIVDLSRLQGSDTIASAKPVDLEDCVLAAVEEVRLIAEDREIDIVVRSDGEAHIVLGDNGLLTTAIRNLISNAVNYSDADTRIVVAITRDDADVVIQVSDQGIGLSAADLERIFERFYRVDPARSRQTGGTGLGLAIVKHVCANHGGQIRVWSEPGVGSTFEMQIPARSATAAEETVGTSRSSRRETAKRKEKS